MQLREGIKISTMSLATMKLRTDALLTQEWVPYWKKETHLPIFESGHVSSHGIIFLSRFILSFCVNFYVPLPKLNMKPWKKKIMASKFGIWECPSFWKAIFLFLTSLNFGLGKLCSQWLGEILVFFSDPTSRILSIPTGVFAEFRTTDHYTPIVHVDWYLCVTSCNLM